MTTEASVRCQSPAASFHQGSIVPSHSIVHDENSVTPISRMSDFAGGPEGSGVVAFGVNANCSGTCWTTWRARSAALTPNETSRCFAGRVSHGDGQMWVKLLASRHGPS
ncbi:hypothetical protein M404DRAFT_1002156 [Pisolithus tinctorius Marx 270]|uniref:Uncharacterized protein n=1 Tax=Pisolithus tinctorius Marx 270 TaxID=870435 RepID=A0A0C3J0C3_PISTI|nr:hypothetical protein M404DRAFT_1002156 [Pisolithus tinctorius Marx 270]